MGRKNPSPAKLSLQESLAKLRAAGFEIAEQGGGRSMVRRHGCAAVLEESGGEARFAVRPGLLQGQTIAHLIDRGFQKFWQDGSRSVPARADELKALHQFQTELRAALGFTTLYNESLGTVSSRYVYDRVEGREPGRPHEPFD